MKKRINSMIIFYILSAVLIFVTANGLISFPVREQSSPKVVSGELDLSAWKYQGAFPLNGEWDFYWSQFLYADDFKNKPEPDLMADLPSVWNQYELNDKNLPGYGYATYRLHVTNANPGEKLAMRICPLSTAYDLWIDGEKLVQCGLPGKTEKQYHPEYRVKVVEFTPDQSSFDIILHVSNFTHARGGAWFTLYMGTVEPIDYMDTVLSGNNYFLLGGFFIIAAFCLLIYSLRRWSVLLLFFAMCILLIFRTALYGNYMINTFLPLVSVASMVRGDYITLYWLQAVYCWILNVLYPMKISKKISIGYLIFALIMSAVTLAAPVRFFTSYVNITIMGIFFVLCYGVASMFSAIRKKEEDTLYFFGGFIILSLCAVRDILFQQNFIKSGFMEYTPTGFLILTMLWGCVIILRYDRLLKEKNQAIISLQESRDRERKAELMFLKSQIRPHFLNNALSAIITISRTDQDKSRKLLEVFSRYLRNCYDFKSLEDVIPIENELDHVRSYLMLEQARFREDLKVEYDIDQVSVMVPPLILQPLVENAVNHGIRRNPGGAGTVRIYVKSEGDDIRIGVEDNGVGFPQDRIESILYGNTGSRGVGLFNINQRLNKIYQVSLNIQNLEPGADVSMLIPRKRGDKNESSNH